jgi:hypothetical protein
MSLRRHPTPPKPRWRRPRPSPRAASATSPRPEQSRRPPPAGTRGRFAPRPKPALRGRRVALEAARAERAMPAPWPGGIKQARLVKRLLMLQAQNARREQRGQTPRIANLRIYPMNPGGEPSPTGSGERATKTPIYRGAGGETAAPLAQTARIANLRIYPMNPGAASLPTDPGEDATRTSIRRGAGGETAAPSVQTARIANPRIYPMNPGGEPSPTGPGEGTNKTSMQRGAVAPPTDPTGAAGERADKSPLHPGTVPPVAKPLQWGCWAAPPPTIRGRQSWRRNSRPPPVDRR